MFNNIKFSFKNHMILSLAIILLPFSSTTILGDNLLGIKGLKLLNIIGVSLFFLWIYKRGQILNYNNKARFKASLVYLVFITLYSVAFLRSFYNLDTLVFRYSDEFYKFYGSSLGYALSYWVKPILMTAPFIYIINHVKTREEIESVLNLVLLALLSFSILTLTISMEVVLSGGSRHALNEGFSRLLGFHYNTVGTILMFSLPVFLSKAITDKGWWTISFGIVLISLLMAQSRGAIIGGVSGILLFLFIRGKVNVSLIVMICLMGVIAWVLATPLLDLFSQGLESRDLSEVSSGRIDSMWIPLLNELIDKPLNFLLGYGHFGVIMTDAYVSNPYFYQATHAHNAYIDFVVNFGLIVFLPMLFVLSITYKRAFREFHKIENPIYLSLLCSIFTYLIASFFGRKFYPDSENLMLIILMSLAVAFVINQSTYRKETI